jgi:hypothetical protein
MRRHLMTMQGSMIVNDVLSEVVQSKRIIAISIQLLICKRIHLI